MQQSEFQHIPATFWVYLLLPFTVIAVTFIGIRTHNPFMFGLIGVIPFAILLMNRIDLWLVSIFAFYNSNLLVPGILGQLELFHVLIAGLIGVVFLRWIIRKEGTSRKAWMWRFLYLFAVVLVVTISARGTGFRFLGDSRWGGMRYVEIFLTLAFVFLVAPIHLKPQQWRMAIIAMFLLSLVPAIADAIFIVTNGVVYQQYYLIKHGAVGEAFQTFGTGELTRFTSSASAGTALLTLPFILFPLTHRHFWKYAVFIVIGLALLSVSGFRLAVIQSLAFIWLYLFITQKGRRILLVIGTVAFAVVGLSVLYAVIPELPLSVQRTFSFIPFLNIDPIVAINAHSTISWRWTVWKNAYTEIPDYWLLGKGYTYDPLVLASFMENRSPEDWARIQVAYHNGPLSLLIGMGVFGLFAGIGVLLSAVVRHYRQFISAWQDSALKRFHGVFLTLLIVRVVVFFTVYGDVHISFPGVFKILALLEGLVVANQVLSTKVQEDAAALPVTTPTVLAPRPRVIRPGF